MNTLLDEVYSTALPPRKRRGASPRGPRRRGFWRFPANTSGPTADFRCSDFEHRTSKSELGFQCSISWVKHRTSKSEFRTQRFFFFFFFSLLFFSRKTSKPDFKVRHPLEKPFEKPFEKPPLKNPLKNPL